MKKEQVQIIAEIKTLVEKLSSQRLEIKTLVEKLEISLKKDGITLPRPAVDKNK